jgi:hypothetical protein
VSLDRLYQPQSRMVSGGEFRFERDIETGSNRTIGFKLLSCMNFSVRNRR